MGRKKAGSKPLLGSGNQPRGYGEQQRDEEGMADSVEERRMNTPLSFGTKFAFGMGKKSLFLAFPLPDVCFCTSEIQTCNFLGGSSGAQRCSPGIWLSLFQQISTHEAAHACL